MSPTTLDAKYPRIAYFRGLLVLPVLILLAEFEACRAVRHAKAGSAGATSLGCSIHRASRRPYRKSPRIKCPRSTGSAATMASRVDGYCSQLADFAAQAMGDAATEVRGGLGAHAKEVAADLDSLILQVRSRKPGDGLKWADSSWAPAEAVRDKCWSQLSEGGGWPNVGWREAYTFALMVQALIQIERSDAGLLGEGAGSLQEAVRCLDLVLIMAGAGAAVWVHTVMTDIEPLVFLWMRTGTATGNREEGGSSKGEGKGEDDHFTIPCALPHAAGASLPTLKEDSAIPRVKGIKISDFKKKFFKADKSVIIEGAIDDWPARQRWCDLRYLRSNFGHRTVPVELGKLDGARKLAGWKEEALLMRDFLDQHVIPSNQRCRSGEKQEEVAYLAQHALFDQLPRLFEDLKVPEYTECGELEGVNAWLGTSGTVTPLHHDSYDNLLTQVVGFKYVRLYEPKETKYLYVSKVSSGGINAQGNISPIDCERPDTAAYPLAADAAYTEAILGPGMHTHTYSHAHPCTHTHTHAHPIPRPQVCC